MKSLLVFTILMLVVYSAHSKIKIVKPKKATDRQIASSDITLAKLSFLSFLKCGSDENLKDTGVRTNLHLCMKSFMTSNSNLEVLKRYDFIFFNGFTYSEAYLCPSSREKFLRDLERIPPDLILCFEFDDGRLNIGHIFYTNENGIMKIRKISL